MTKIKEIATLFILQMAFSQSAQSDPAPPGGLAASELNRLISSPAYLSNLRISPIPLINHGVLAIPGEFPWMVALATVDSTGTLSFFCGGTLISSKIILTAAHCNKDNPESVRVFYGDIEWMQNFSNAISIKKFHIFPDYKDIDQGTDVAMITLSAPITNVKPIKLAVSDDSSFKEGSLLQIMGWGNTVGEAMRSDTLQKGYVKIYPPGKCKDQFDRSSFSSSLICAGGDERYAAACRYDSGGPAVLSKNGKLEQVAIISFGARCKQGSNISAYTIITEPIRNWISTVSLDIP